MKILQVTHGFPPDQMAGAEIYAYNVSRGLQREGLDVVVLSPGSRAGFDEYAIVTEDVDGLRVLRLNNNYRDLHDLASTYANPDIDRVFSDVLAAERPDVVHVHHTIGTTAHTIPLASAAGCAVVVTLHDFWFHCARGQRITPRNHLCTEVQPWRCSLCVGKKRVRYALNWVVDYARGRTRDTRGEGLARRGALFLPRFVGYAARETALSPIRRRLGEMKAALHEADLILAPSEFLLETFAKEGAPRDRLVLSEYGMDHARFDGVERVPRAAGAPLRFGFVGTLIPSKGVELLVRAFQALPVGAAVLDVHGSGGGPNGPRFEAGLRALNCHPGVTFHGRFHNRDVGRVLAGLDVLVVPSLWYENAPLTLHEAAMAGIAVLTSDHGGMREFVARFGNGLTFAPGDADALATALRRFVAEPDLAASLAQPRRGVRTVEDDVRGLLGHYRRVLAARRS